MTRVSGSSGVSESTIVFYNGGHSHDGVSSSLVDTDEYSIYDWTVGYVGSGSRLSRQQTNFNALKEVITNVVVDSLLGPTGIRLAPNTLHATVIESGTISANQLSANIVLINNVIKSNNYVANTSGWAIHGNGFAEFDFAVIRGTVVADSIYINALNYWYSNGTFSVGVANNIMLFNGTNLELTGTVIATAGQIAGFTISGDNLITGGAFAGSIELGPTSYSGAPALHIESSAGDSYVFGDSIQIEHISNGGLIDLSATNRQIIVSNGSTSTTIDHDSVTSDTFFGNLSGNASTADNADNADELDGYAISTGFGAANTIAPREGDASIGAQYFRFNGGVTGTGSVIIRRSDGYILVQASKRELKENIEDIPDALLKILSLRPRQFNWKRTLDDPDDIYHQQIKYNHKTMGFVVEEVQEANPEYLEYSIKDGELDGHYWKTNDFIALAIQGIKDLSAKVTSLEQRIAQLEG